MLKALRRQTWKKVGKTTNPRLVKFVDEYLRLGNAYEAAKNAGYSEAYAVGHGHELARKVKVNLSSVARAKGLNEHRLIGKYETFLDAKEPKWNSDSKGWDLFENSKVQLEATRDLAEIIEPRQSQTTFGAAVGPGRDGRPTLQVVLQHTVSRPDRSKQAVKTFDLPPVVPTNGADHGDAD